jgi:hypothetical protein
LDRLKSALEIGRSLTVTSTKNLRAILPAILPIMRMSHRIRGIPTQVD